MCGLAAIFAYDPDAPAVDEGELTAIRDQMTPRGPDGAGNWFDGRRRIGLGHRRLSIIDLSPSGAQPMLLPQRQLAIVFNGEIYNYRELRARLESKGCVFQSTSDTEVLLHLYVQHGPALVNDLRGMFAFALWDGKQRGLLLARDPFGIKPLYVADNGKSLRAASQVKALLAGRGFTTTASAGGHAGFFLWGHVPEPFTLHREIRALPAGSTLWVGADGSRREQTYFGVTEILSRAEADGAPVSDPARISAFNVPLSTLLKDSVAHHLLADVPVGVFLSAGLDSTTLASLAAEQGGALRTVTLGFEEFRGTLNDEVPLAETMARHLGAHHRTIWISRQDFESEAARLFAAMDQPSTDGVNTYFVSLAARRAGLKVALSGLGGDELFGGYPGFTQIPRSVSALQRFNGSTLRGVGRAFRAVSAPVVKRFTSPKYAGLLEYGGSYGGAYLLRRGMFMPWELPELLDPDLARAGWQELQTLPRLDDTAAGLRSPRARVSALEMTWYMRNQLLRDSDWAGMAHSLEIRVPLVDMALLRALAPALVSRQPPTKLDLADAPAKKLPAGILNRPKTGFQIPVRDWLLASPLRRNQSPSPAVAGEGGRGPGEGCWEKTNLRGKGQGEVSKSSGRGLRGWARYVHALITGN